MGHFLRVDSVFARCPQNTAGGFPRFIFITDGEGLMASYIGPAIVS